MHYNVYWNSTHTFRNYFMFVNDFFIQTTGTAMGSPMAPNYANLYVKQYSILSKNIYCLTLLYGNGSFMVFLLYGGVMQNSSRHSMLFLTLVLSTWDLLCNLAHVKSVSLIFWLCVDNVLYTDIYRKPTDRNSLLRADSGHQLPLKNSFPYSQFCRIKIICQKQSDFERNMSEMQRNFKDSGYKMVRLK